MALVKCHECGNEISTEAKVCPQCGAKNKKYKKSKIPLLLFILAVIVLGPWLYDRYIDTSIPECESYRASELFTETFEGAPHAQTKNLRVIDVTDQKEVTKSSNPLDRVCQVTFVLNDSTENTYQFSFEKNENGGVYVTGKRIK